MRLTFLSVLIIALSTFIAALASEPKVGDVCALIDPASCGEALWCDPKPATCGERAPSALGKCVPSTRICPRNYNPVCGCNGRTYSNDCGRRAAKQPLAQVGECGALPK